MRIENLSVSYRRDGQDVPAVRDLSLDISSGESLGLIGESGSGKSTVALAVLRLIRPAEGRILRGRILFEGRDLLGFSEAEMRRVRGREIAMVFQDPFTSINPVMRVEEQMQEVLDAHGLAGNNASLAESLERVQLDAAGVLRRYPHQLSGGQRQRVMIAIALLCKPKLLLADEPTTALDVLVQKDILDLLFKLQREMGIALLFVSHNLALIAQYARRVAVMREGKILETGPTNEVLAHPKDSYTRELWAAVPRLTIY